MDNMDHQLGIPVVIPTTSRRPKKLFIIIGIVAILGCGITYFYIKDGSKKNYQVTNQNIKLPPTATPQKKEEVHFEIIDGDLYKTGKNGLKMLLIKKENLNNSKKFTGEFKSIDVQEIYDFSISPRKNNLLLFVDGGISLFYIFYSDIDGNNITLISIAEVAIWSPNGRYIAFTHRPSDVGPLYLYVFDIDYNKIANIVQTKNKINTSYEEFRWASDSASLIANYETRTDIPYGNVIDKGETLIKIK